ncbi:cysteine protease ATG4C isoform X1 [Polyodon spathula]|uniref:cysteine protease ATG4C isoform X1 n=1 Tax=Polyodon spathula TaxID=7913 RepID=UPI001B7F64CC|nr:cysteine protease ATG4C isoform X1 [Polyodon spathula]XP_041126860.1 cysteine protease ATG4C isoform X1 [Polyodon spathula]XP_041126861.1 cysteine protease ATG4C isoform X1 [Polyodon spathula]XP_041126862.1 cysteine protease ATG4C isoform X1 [Polyodon spathula]
MENNERDEVEKLKSMFVSAWHNVQYSWILKTKTYFSRNSPVFLLGKCYHFKAEEASVESVTGSCSGEASERELVIGSVVEFRRDFASRIWLTYREQFPQIQGSSFTSDCGWGCTLRTGQMLLAQGLVLHLLGRDWTWSHALKMDGLDTESWTASAARKLVSSFESSFQGPKPLESPARAPGRVEEASTHLNCVYHRKIVSWFADCPAAQIGVHRLIELGHASGKSAGDWYGPALVAHILGKAVKEATDPELQGITVYVAQDCTVYSADVIDSLQKPAQGPETETRVNRKAVIILIPVRLGGEKTNPEYFDFVKGILSLEYCIGIIGGKPKQAYYFVGFQDDSLIYMDPHYCQSFVDVSMNGFPLESFHCPSPKKMSFTKMDPSCTIGFYTRSVQDFEKISEEIAKVLKPSSKEKYPAFTFVKGHGRDYDYEQSESTSEGEPRHPKYSPGDFVLL